MKELSMKELRKIKYELEDMSKRESVKLFRLARQAEKHGCKIETVQDIREEGCWLHNDATAHPEMLLMYDFERNFKYAFRLGGKRS